MISGQVTVTTAGTAEQGPDKGKYVWSLKAHPDNTDTVWVGSDGAGDVSSANGFPLNPGEERSIYGELNEVWFDADVSGEKICYLLVER